MVSERENILITTVRDLLVVIQNAFCLSTGATNKWAPHSCTDKQQMKSSALHLGTVAIDVTVAQVPLSRPMGCLGCPT